MSPIVVYTTGRTGSSLICRNLSQYFKIPMSYEQYQLHTDIVHCHNPLWTPSDNNSICVLSKRRDTFSLIMSTLVGKQSNEFVDYSGKHIPMFAVSESEFTGCFWFVRCFYHAINTNNFSKIIEIYYEDLMSDPKHLFSQFDINMCTDYYLSEKAPYRYQQLVSNWSELQMLYHELNQQPVTDELIESLKKSVRCDLNQIYNKESLP